MCMHYIYIYEIWCGLYAHINFLHSNLHSKWTLYIFFIIKQQNLLNVMHSKTLLWIFYLIFITHKMNHGSWKNFYACVTNCKKVLMPFFIQTTSMAWNKFLFWHANECDSIESNKSMKLFPSIVTLRFIESSTLARSYQPSIHTRDISMQNIMARKWKRNVRERNKRKWCLVLDAIN